MNLLILIVPYISSAFCLPLLSIFGWSIVVFLDKNNNLTDYIIIKYFDIF